MFDWDFERRGERIQIKVPSRVAVNDSDAYMEACLAGLGIAQTASFQLRPLVAAGEIELLLQDWCIAPVPIHVVYPHNRHLSAKVRVFVEWIAELFSEHPALQPDTANCAQMPAVDESAMPSRQVASSDCLSCV